MKYHKIPKVDKSVCTAEQMIAYNIAFRLHISYADQFAKVNAVNSGGARADSADLARQGLKNYRTAYSYKPGKYDEDAIFSALLAGLYDYFAGEYHIFTSYEDIGQAFPAHYLKEA